MSPKTFYASFGTEIFMIAKNSTQLEKFKSSYGKKIHRIVKNGCTKNRIKQLLLKIYVHNFEIFRTFFPTSLDFLKLMLPLFMFMYLCIVYVDVLKKLFHVNLTAMFPQTLPPNV